MSSFQGQDAVHPLAEYKLVLEADSSSAQDSANSSQFAFQSVPSVQAGVALPACQALWQQEILGQQRALPPLSNRAHVHVTSLRHHQHGDHLQPAPLVPPPLTVGHTVLGPAAPAGVHNFGQHVGGSPHPVQLHLAPLVTAAAADVARTTGSASHGGGSTPGSNASCGGGGSSNKRSASGHHRDRPSEATAPGTPQHMDRLLQAARRVAGQARLRLCGSKRYSEGAEDGIGDLPTPLAPVSSQTSSLLANALVSWQWDAFAFVAGCQVRPLATLALHLLRVSGLVDHFALPLAPLTTWLGRVEEGYSAACPYHNATHAADVLQKMHMIMSPAGGLLAALGGDPLLLLAAYLAAVVHDYQHTGVTNAFLVTVGHDLAVTYNDVQPHENHHIAAAWRLTRSRNMDFLSGMPPPQRTRLRRLMVGLVLATDMQQHAALTQRFTSLVQQAAGGGAGAAEVGAPVLLQEQHELVLQVALKVADLGHLTSSWPVHQRWVAALEEEFFRQGDQERAQGLPLTPMMDRSSPGITSSQTGFLDMVALPLLSSLAAVMPGCRTLLAAAQHNRNCWAQHAAAAAAVAAGK